MSPGTERASVRFMRLGCLGRAVGYPPPDHHENRRPDDHAAPSPGFEGLPLTCGSVLSDAGTATGGSTTGDETPGFRSPSEYPGGLLRWACPSVRDFLASLR